MFLSIRFALTNFFSSGWSRWMDIEYIIKSNSNFYFEKELCLLQMKVNSKTGIRKYHLIHIMSSNDEDFLNNVAKTLHPKLNVKNK